MDITKISGADLGIVDTDKYCYIMTYSFPCQDLSVAGKMKGMAKGDNTRSGLLWEVERLLNEVEHLPQVLLMENVTQVHSKANMPDFQRWIDFLESKGYSNWHHDLNAKHYGVAQNRDRTFMVSILGDYQYKFPEPIPLTKTMKDYLEDEVDERFYINSEKARQLIQQLDERGELEKLGRRECLRQCIELTVVEPKGIDIANCLTTVDRGIKNFRGEGNGVVEGNG
jgi:DNA (cytosine-5)-methyltransferase 1